MESLETENKREVATILKQYKLPNGSANYPAVFSIPLNERLPALAAKDFTRLNLVIIGALTMAFEAMNLKRGMNEFQILNLAEEIIDSSSEDNLSLEDLMLFLQNMVRGKYQMSYESLDIPKFMALFETYRQERHASILRLREDLHLQYKGLGSAERTAKEDALSEHFSRLGDTLGTLKANMKELKKENHVLKQMDKL